MDIQEHKTQHLHLTHCQIIIHILLNYELYKLQDTSHHIIHYINIHIIIINYILNYKVLYHSLHNISFYTFSDHNETCIYSNNFYKLHHILISISLHNIYMNMVYCIYYKVNHIFYHTHDHILIFQSILYHKVNGMFPPDTHHMSHYINVHKVR